MSLILILAGEDDQHALAVADELKKMGAQHAFFQPGNFLYDWSLNAHPADAVKAKLKRKDESASIDLAEVRSVWWRRPAAVKSHPMPEEWIEDFVSWESSRALDGLLTSLPALHVNSPFADRRALLKVHQLHVAAQCGFDIPISLVTNDAAEARTFIERQQSNVIYKPLDERSVRYMPMNEVPRGIPTTPVRSADLGFLSQVEKCMHLFQERVAKKCDVRVTVCGARIFAAEIDSQSGNGIDDFRLDFSVGIKEHDLPLSVRDSCFRLLERLDLTFGAIDLGLTADGKYKFFEINPAGQWLWIEQATKLSISQAVAETLASSAAS